MLFTGTSHSLGLRDALTFCAEAANLEAFVAFVWLFITAGQERYESAKERDRM